MPIKYTALFVYLLFALKVNAQNSHPKDTVIDGVKYEYVERMPRPNYNLNKYLSKNIHYPDSARAHNIEGRVIVKFLVNEDGQISDCKIINSVDRDCDAEALRVVKEMPRWKPGKQDGKPVKVFFHLPIMFKLTD